MEIKVLWADTQAIVWRMFSLSRMLLHLLPFPSFTACSQVFEDVSFGASSRWLSSASIKTEKNLTLRKRKDKKENFFFFNSWFLSTHFVTWSLMCQLNHGKKAKRTERATDIFKCYRRCLFPTDSKPGGNKTKRRGEQTEEDRTRLWCAHLPRYTQNETG